MGLIQGCKGDEIRHLACLLLFVKFWNKLVLMSNLCKRVIIELLWAVNNIIFAPYLMYIASDGLCNCILCRSGSRQGFMPRRKARFIEENPGRYWLQVQSIS